MMIIAIVRRIETETAKYVLLVVVVVVVKFV